MKRYLTWRLLPVFLFGVLVAFFWRGLSLNPQHLPSVQLDQKLPSFEVPILGDKTRLLSSGNIKGHPALLHVFASWCDVCSEEQVFLLKLSDNGVPLYGLNYKDDPFDAMHWLQTWGNPYRLIGVDRDGHLGIDLGVYGTPETFLVDSSGFIRYRHVGILNETTWEQILRPKWEALS
ncbi:MAG: DsbE family thiol:disulfide interchange protein [Gammaproteobacteria bacterium]|nr:DsbE family thiol:disulfide interchange protein [Gammaproteobacteria bacterium]